MKLSILTATALLALAAAMPVYAQKRAERITCFRERNIISCPGYGDFNIRSDNRRFDNRRFDDDRRTDNRFDRYDDNRGLIAINEIYLQILGRKVDPSGARTYTNALNNGWTLERVRTDIAFSSEAEQVINRAYLDILRRNVDPSGLDTYRRFLAGGRSIADVRQDLANSAEARRR